MSKYRKKKKKEKIDRQKLDYVSKETVVDEHTKRIFLYQKKRRKKMKISFQLIDISLFLFFLQIRQVKIMYYNILTNSSRDIIKKKLLL
jgi:hypothetical protein